ncbi:M23 family metallopeptidase [Caminibacter profundus]
MKFISIALILTLLFSSSIKKELKQTKIVISKMNEKMDLLAKEIVYKQQNLKKLSLKINELNIEIQKLQQKLKNSNQTLNELTDLKRGHLTQLKEIQNEINDFLSTNYYLNTQEIDNINDLIYNELNQKILKVYSQKINKLINKKENLENKISITNKKIEEIKIKQNTLKVKKNELLSLLKKRKKELNSLESKKREYKRKLLALINKQKKLQKKLASLLIIKRAQKPTTFTYKGMKTIAPLRGKVIKKFGSYIDPIYKIKIYNDSITIKPFIKNATVRSIMPGRVVYIGENGGKKIIVIKHKNNIFSIYANLSKVSPLLKKGSFVKRGQIIARVKDSLEFEVTYKEKPINPLKVISLQ